jgi:hypothetical protein
MESTVDGTGGRTTAAGDVAYMTAEATRATARAILAGKLLKRFTL